MVKELKNYDEGTPKYISKLEEYEAHVVYNVWYLRGELNYMENITSAEDEICKKHEYDSVENMLKLKQGNRLN